MNPKTRSTVRVGLSPVQMCNMLDLFANLGGRRVEKSYSSILQRLVEHLLENALSQGLIPPVSVEEASQRLLKEDPDLIGELALSEFNLLPSESPKMEKLKAKIEQALVNDSNETNTGLDNLFGKP